MPRKLMLLFILLLPVALSAQNESKSHEQFLEEIVKKIPEMLQDISIPGAALVINKDGEIVLQK